MSEIIVTYVKPGETLSEIAARYGVSVDALQRWNSIENPDLVLVGQRLVVYNGADAPGSSASGSAVSQTEADSHLAGGSSDILIGGAIVLGFLLLLFLLRRKRHAVPPISRAPSPCQPQQRITTGQDHTLRRPRTAAAVDPLPTPQVNDGECLVSSELVRHYSDWIMINDVLLPSGRGTTQIDHILVSPKRCISNRD